MSSTYSSDEAPRSSGRSPTEALAARYRHLFVLPSKQTLLVLNAIASLVLSIAGVGGQLSPRVSAVAILAALLFPFVISEASRLADSTTVATFRRSMAVTLAGTLVWLFCAGVGLIYSAATHSALAFGNSLVFGAFLCWGWETLVINGAFVEQTVLAAFLGSLQPAFTMAAALFLGGVPYNGYVTIPSAVAFALLLLFTVSLRQKTTSRGHNAVKLFQAFMKTWASKDASGLESIIASHAEKAQVSSNVLRFQSSGGDIFIVLPGVHPGPFYPVGSYNLPGLITRAFEGTGQVLALHRPGGHERNLATNAEAVEYARKLKEFAATLGPTQEPAEIQGPTVARIGKATVTSAAFAKNLLVAVSFAPYGSDDLELDFEKKLSAVASSEGYNVSVVDAHNSIDTARNPIDPDNQQWRQLIKDVKQSGQGEFRIGFARSREQEFPSANDITANGIGLAVIETSKAKWVLALADANNSVSDLRSTISTALESSGYKLLEFCTSDSHDLAARGLTVNRGYSALGEATPASAIAGATVKLAKLAESRLASCGFAVGTMTSEANLFGAVALNEFATITRQSSRFAKRYAVLAGLGLIVLFSLGLVL